MNNNDFGNKLVFLRKEQKLSQKELATSIGVSQKAIDFWGKNANEPKASYITALAAFFKVSTDYLLGLENEDYTKNYDNMQSTLSYSADELELISTFKKLNSRDKRMAKAYLNTMLDYELDENTNKRHA